MKQIQSIDEDTVSFVGQELSKIKN
jgi:hypothetical protein